MIKVLFVEDNRMIAKMWKTGLEKHGLEVELTDRGDTAHELLKTKNYDAVLTDIMVPGIDGFELTRKIKQNDKIQFMPVVILSASSSPQQTLKAKEVGVNKYFIKSNTTPKEVADYINGINYQKRCENG